MALNIKSYPQTMFNNTAASSYNWRKFELLITDCFSNKLNFYNVKSNYFHTKRGLFKNKKHQYDIIFTYISALEDLKRVINPMNWITLDVLPNLFYYGIIECKYSKCENKIESCVVDELTEKIKFYKANKGIIVTNSNLTTAAHKQAKRKGYIVYDGDKTKDLILSNKHLKVLNLTKKNYNLEKILNHIHLGKSDLEPNTTVETKPLKAILEKLF